MEDIINLCQSVISKCQQLPDERTLCIGFDGESCYKFSNTTISNGGGNRCPTHTDAFFSSQPGGMYPRNTKSFDIGQKVFNKYSKAPIECDLEEEDIKDEDEDEDEDDTEDDTEDEKEEKYKDEVIDDIFEYDEFYF